MNKAGICILLLVIVATGCARQKSYAQDAPKSVLDGLRYGVDPLESPPAAPKKDPTPTCYSKPQCDAMWSEATSKIQALTGMRLQQMSDTYLTTYNGSPGRMAAEARRIPRPDGSTVIQSDFSCNYCSDDLAIQAQYLFSLSVSAAGEGFPEPYRAPRWEDEIGKQH